VTGAWRLLIDGPAEGAWNMAIDRAVQLARHQGDAPPTLRLYAWVRPTATLGRFQDVSGADREVCEAEGIDISRRPTGGRGVLHDDEVTYSVVASVADGVPRGTAASYRYLCEALAKAYRTLGVDAALTTRGRGESSSAACYLHATRADLSLGARKLSGSAQVWHHDTVLQHGSFTRTRDVAREARVFRLAPDSAAKLARETVTLADALGEAPTHEEIAGAIRDAFSEVLGVELVPGDLSESEIRTAEELVDGFRAR